MTRWKNAEQWAHYVVRAMKNNKPIAHGGQGIGSRYFEAAFEGGWAEYPIDSEEVIAILLDRMDTDAKLVDATLRHYELDGKGVIKMIEKAKAMLEPHNRPTMARDAS